MDRIRILFVDDEAIVREGLKKCIDWEVNGFEVVGAAENGEKALAQRGGKSHDGQSGTPSVQGPFDGSFE